MQSHDHDDQWADLLSVYFLKRPQPLLKEAKPILIKKHTQKNNALTISKDDNNIKEFSERDIAIIILVYHFEHMLHKHGVRFE